MLIKDLRMAQPNPREARGRSSAAVAASWPVLLAKRRRKDPIFVPAGVPAAADRQRSKITIYGWSAETTLSRQPAQVIVTLLGGNV
jgi:hypothetical protein